MITKEFTEYVRKKLASGVGREAIANIVVNKGWTIEDLDEAIKTISKNPLAPNNILPNKEARKLPDRTNQKLTISIGLIVASILYAIYQNTHMVSNTGGGIAESTLPVVVKNSQVENQVRSPSQVSVSPAAVAPANNPTIKPPTINTTTPKQVSTNTANPAPKHAPTPAPVSKPAGQYLDGTYIGSSEDAYYGTIQVEAIIKNGALSNVQFLQYPSDRSTSRRINSRAMPILTQEAISAQSANVNIVSGATDSSQAFRQSLAQALNQAKNI